MNAVIWVALGGALGACARYGTGVAFERLFGEHAHWGNLACNVIGSFLTGLLFGALMRGDVNDEQRLFFGVGMLGAYAAFSFFSLDTIRMIEEGAWVNAFGYATATVLLSLGAIGFGLTLARGS